MFGNERKKYAVLAELADAHGSGPCEVHSWGFDSLRPHHFFKIEHKQICMRSWRNWQTRTVQVRVRHTHGGSTPLDRTTVKEAPNRVLFSYTCAFAIAEVC